ncbi:DEAD/DEAH box helicase family protein [Viridibacillus arvi]|uniref:DEAD/DEAH box helicase family protein n=1 Tax=Viridibacillus arvi TaxID=263475 RepID=UPI00187B6A75|nr:DEAD/DEAH box helicase family protein [Viridibacillus sp. JNUCC-6]QOV13204.1 DEAD/DEAH box helicase family protein [Viridibacillus sp. JNUCC-6]
MNKYVSEYFTEEFMKSLSNEWIYLLGAECGSGKTTAIMKKLVPFAERENKRVLYLCNRIALIEQLKSKYKYKEQGDAVVEINKNLTIAMYQKITAILTYGAEVSEVIGGEYDYVILDEAHLLYDASDYD